MNHPQTERPSVTNPYLSGLPHELRHMTLDEMTGGAADPLATAIRDAQEAHNTARRTLRDAQARFVEAQAHALARLYGNGDIGKNDRERKRAEDEGLLNDVACQRAQMDVTNATRLVERTEAELDFARNQLSVTKIKAQLMSALLLSGVLTVTPRPSSLTDMVDSVLGTASADDMAATASGSRTSLPTMTCLFNRLQLRQN